MHRVSNAEQASEREIVRGQKLAEPAGHEFDDPQEHRQRQEAENARKYEVPGGMWDEQRGEQRAPQRMCEGGTLVASRDRRGNSRKEREEFIH